MKGASFKFIKDCDKKLLNALQRMPREDMGPIAVAMLGGGAQRVVDTAKALAPKDTSTLVASIKATKVKERFAKNKSVWRQAVRTGTRKQLGIRSDAKGYYPASMEYGFRFPPKTMENAASKMYAFQSRGKLDRKGNVKKRALLAAEKRQIDLAQTVGGHTYYDMKEGRFRRSPTNLRFQQRPFMRPALYNNVGQIANDARMVVASMIPAAFIRAVR